MVPWNQAYARIKTSEEWVTRFGKMYSQDEFRYYAYSVKFNAVQPALLASTAILVNTGSVAVTRTNLAAPTTNIVSGPPSQALLDFPAGAVILGISAAAVKGQRIADNGAPIAFTYAPSSSNPGNRDLFVLDLSYNDNDNIVGQNPIPETASNPNSAVITAPPIDAAALLSGGMDTDTPARELYVTPGLGLIIVVRSMVLPDFAPEAPSQAAPNMAVHLVFHCMIPGRVSVDGSKAA